jgi:hypothetical protein
VPFDRSSADLAAFVVCHQHLAKFLLILFYWLLCWNLSIGKKKTDAKLEAFLSIEEINKKYSEYNFTSQLPLPSH